MSSIENSSLFKNIEGIHHLKNSLVILVKTEWNADIVNELEKGCKKLLVQHGIRTKTLVVPGAVEIPFTINQYWNTATAKAKPLAFIAFGCVIKGDTPHFE